MNNSRFESQISKFQNSKLQLKIKNYKKLFLVLLIFFVFYLLFIDFRSSIIWQKKDRLNVIFYGQNTVFYSLSFDNISYQLRLPADVEVLVPGGYGYYRIGALGKLFALEKKPAILKKTISLATATFVDLYFYPASVKIYYEDENLKNKFVSEQITKPLVNFYPILFYKSNATVLDRLFLLFFFLTHRPREYKIIENLPIKKEEERKILNLDSFFKTYQGIFYKKTYRNEKINVQIIYTRDYQTAKLLSQILEGEGIRVVDISQKKIDINKRCFLISSEKNQSKITRDLQNFFGCSLKKGETTVSDIILELGNLEKEWEIK